MYASWNAGVTALVPSLTNRSADAIIGLQMRWMCAITAFTPA